MTSNSPLLPAYEESSACTFQWRVRNVKLRSQFASRNPESNYGYREHYQRMLAKFLQQDAPQDRLKPITPPSEPSRFADLQYSQAFANIGCLIQEYRNCVTSISPLREEDVLFLLLREYAEASGAVVYAEIRRPKDVQIYDSSIAEPADTSALAQCLGHTTGVVNAELCVERPPEAESYSPTSGLDQYSCYSPLPQSPSAFDSECSVTVHFPEMNQCIQQDLIPGNALSEPPSYAANLSDTKPSLSLPYKDQDASFSVLRCHHRGIEHGDELPFGFTDVLEQMLHTPSNIYYASYDLISCGTVVGPQAEGGLQSFACRLSPSEVDLFLTVERRGDILAYSCYRDEEIWAACHEHHNDNVAGYGFLGYL